MNNKPFSVIIIITATIAAILASVFLTRSENGFTWGVFLTICIPYLILSLLAVVRQMPNAANFFYCVASLAQMIYGLLLLADYATNHSDMKVLGFMSILVFQIGGLIIPLGALLLGLFISALIRSYRYNMGKNDSPQV